MEYLASLSRRENLTIIQFIAGCSLVISMCDSFKDGRL